MSKLRTWLRGGLGFLYGTFCVGILVNLISNLLSFPLLWDWLVQHIPVVSLCGALVVLSTVLAWWPFHKRGDQAGLSSPFSPVYRKKLIQRLLQTYQLQRQHALQSQSYLPLRLHERLNATRPPHQRIFSQRGANQPVPFPSGTSLLEVCEQTAQDFLLLGASGAGKTMLLLDLACKLLMQGEHDPDSPIPVILNLSSWAKQKLPLESWLLDQLHFVYGIPPSLGQPLLNQDRWFFLLDDFDKLDVAVRSQCVKVINTYRKGHLAPLIVCSRSHEYLSGKTKLSLSIAVEIQPLQDQEVLAYLKNVGKPMAAVRVVLRTHPTLKQLINTPLMLRVVSTVYYGKGPRDLPQAGSAEEVRKKIFSRYVQMMLEPQEGRSFSSRQTVRFLAWLARQMKQHSQVEFYLEHLQQKWLPSPRVQRRFSLLTLLCIYGFGNLLGLGAFFVITFSKWFTLFSVAIPVAFAFQMLYLGPRLSKEEWSIEPGERLAWSWKKSLMGWIWAPVAAMVNADSLTTRISTALCVGLAAVIVNGLATRSLPEHIRTRPNQGIHDSGLRSLWSGLLYFLVISLVAWFLGGRVSDLFAGLAAGLAIGWVVGTYYGGISCCRHYLLRFLLWHRGVIPWRFVRFLDESVKCILLQRVGSGGGYSFIHSLFLDYFATLDPADGEALSQSVPPASSSEVKAL
jgi:hypothetical protein